MVRPTDSLLRDESLFKRFPLPIESTVSSPFPTKVIEPASSYASIEPELPKPTPRLIHPLFWNDPVHRQVEVSQLTQKISQDLNQLHEVALTMAAQLGSEEAAPLKAWAKQAQVYLFLNRGKLREARNFLLDLPLIPEHLELLEKIDSGLRTQRLLGGIQILGGATSDYFSNHFSETSAPPVALELSLQAVLAETMGLLQSGESKDFRSAFRLAMHGSAISDRLGDFADESNEGSQLWGLLQGFTDPQKSDGDLIGQSLSLAGTFSLRNYFQTVSQISRFVQDHPQATEEQKAMARLLEENISTSAALNRTFFAAQELISLFSVAGNMLNPNIRMDGEYFKRAGWTVGTLGVARSVGVGVQAWWVARMENAIASPFVLRLSTTGLRSVSEAAAFPLAGMTFQSLYSKNNAHWTFQNFATEFGSLLVLFSFLNASRMAVMETGIRNSAVDWGARVGAFTASSYANEAWQEGLGLDYPEQGVKFYARVLHSTVVDRQMMMGTRIVDGFSGGHLARMELASENILRQRFLQPSEDHGDGEGGNFFGFGDRIYSSASGGFPLSDFTWLPENFTEVFAKKPKDHPDSEAPLSRPSPRESGKVPRAAVSDAEAMTALNAVPVPIMITNSNGMILYANEMASQLLALSGDGVSGKNLSELLQPTMEDKTTFTPRDLMTRGVVLKMQSISLSGAGGHQVYYLQDVTRMRYLEKAHELSQTLLRINHDANNMRTSVDHFIAYQLPKFEQTYRDHAKNAPTFKEDMGSLEDFRKATKDINGIMMAARELIRGGVLVKEPIRLKDCVDHALNSLERMRKIYSHRVELNLDENLIVEGNRPYTLNAFINLIKNAYEAMPMGEGYLKIDGTLAKDSREVIIDFTDNGTGISPEHLPHIFDLYFTTKFDGTGIGLANVKQTVEENLLGKIEVASEPGKGTRFRLRLPILQSF